MRTRKSVMALAPLFFCLALIARADDAPQAWNTDHFFDSDGVRIRYITLGEGEPVVLVHGFTATLESNWGPRTVKKLAENYRAIAFDNRGHGKSDKPHSPEAYGTHMVDDIVRLLDHLGIEKAHIVGYSMGGFITAKMTTMYPERMLSATLGGAGWMDPENQVIELNDELAQSLENGHGMGPLIKALTPAGRPEPTEQQIAVINNMMEATNDVKALAAVIRAMGQLSVTREELEANQVPTLALIGSIDPLIASVIPMQGVMPNLEIVRIEGANHLTASRHPVFMSALQTHLARNKSRVPRELQPSLAGE